MEIVEGRRYRVVVRFPWGERREFACESLVREADGTLRWAAMEEFGLEPFLDAVTAEEEGWVMGFVGGTCDVVAVLSFCDDPPEP